MQDGSDRSPAPAERTERGAAPAAPHVRTALFVDFDNIYLRIQQEDPRAAEQFATNPARWLAWLQRHLSFEESPEPRRKILFRRCYLNPTQFGRFRPDFIRAAFEVVDCPPLTSGGKTSADIRMVMDILDTLVHPTHFDELILLSGDADFTPVLLRLSKYDRRSAVLAVGPASAAYKAACDLLIDEDTFLEEAIGADASARAAAGAAPSASAEASPMAGLLGEIANKVYERTSASGELYATDLPGIYREFPEFTASTNWLGFNSLRNMTWQVVHARPDLAMVDGDPWKVRVRAGGSGGAAPHAAAEAADREEPAERPAPPPPLDPEANARLGEQILDFVRSTVAIADSAMPMARMAQLVIGQFGEEVLSTRWAGAGTFRDLLATRANPGFVISPFKPGFLYDPDQHQVPAERRPDDLESAEPELATLAFRVHQLTDTPYLTSTEYALLFRLIAEEVTQHGYFLHRTSKAVRDRCIEEGSPIARMSVNFVLRGIAFSGYRYNQTESEDPAVLADRFGKNVLVLCDSAGLQLTDEERKKVWAWIAGASQGVAAEPELAALATSALPAAGSAGAEDTEGQAAEGEPTEGEAAPSEVPQGETATV